MEQQAKFEGWAVIELFGHQREAGFVTTQYFGNAAMFQLDVPELPEREYESVRAQWIESTLAPAGSKLKKEAKPGRSRLINPSAVYAMNPCSEEMARKTLEELAPRDVQIVKLAESRQLTAAERAEQQMDVDNDYEDSAEELPI